MSAAVPYTATDATSAEWSVVSTVGNPMSSEHTAPLGKKGTEGRTDHHDEPLIELPDVFIEKFDADIEKAKRSATTTPDDEHDECPRCGSIRIFRKITEDNRSRPEDWRCERCGAHFNDPAPPGEGGEDGEDEEQPDDRDRPELEPGQSSVSDFGGGA